MTSKRKVKHLYKSKKATPNFKSQKTKQYKSDEETYASAPIGEYTVPEDNSYKKDIGMEYTVSIAYNKGAYQVIPKGEVKDIASKHYKVGMKANGSTIAASILKGLLKSMNTSCSARNSVPHMDVELADGRVLSSMI